MFKSLRFRFSAILISLAVGPLLLVAVLLTRQSNNYLEQQSQTLLYEIAVKVGNEIRSFIEDHSYHLAFGHKLYAIELLDTEKQKTVLNNLLYDQQVYQDLALLNREGMELMQLARLSFYFDRDL
mgnify:CR=1 FL=1